MTIHLKIFLLELRETRVGEILACRVREMVEIHGLVKPHVLLVDHGSPTPVVNATIRALFDTTMMSYCHNMSEVIEKQNES
jgi:fructose/tagatose bisphosphate aldolase